MPARPLPALALAAVLAVPSAAQPPKPDPDHAAKMAKGTELFKSRVRGVLEAKCLKCHTGDRVEGEFDLGTRDRVLKGGLGGPAVKPGDHKASLLYQLVAHLKAPHMPHERPKLPADDIKAVADWIDLGAPYDRPLAGADDAAWTRKVVAPDAKKHWAFQPLRRPPTPANPGRQPGGGSPNPIDGFVLDRLEKAGLKPNPPADPRTLIRRVYLDLIGLPPTPEQVEAFAKDPSPAAYAKVVDDLLASPRYGERWARPWLDLVRFAESHGFEHDYDRPTAYHYRDFVIRALNEDVPYDTFVRWQIAGDETDPANPLALAATGYLAAGVHSTQITKREVEKHRYDELDDILANVGTTFLGLTVGCARCHDHKFDPVPARDYYRMLSAFTTAVRTEVDIDTDPAGYARDKAAFDAKHKPFADALAKYERDELPARFAAWDAARDRAARPAGWVLPELVSAKSAGGATLTPQPDGSLLAGGTNPPNDTFTIEVSTTLAGVKALRLEALSHPSLVKGGPGRASNGNFALTDLTVTARPKAGGKAVPVKLTSPRATFEQKGLPVAAVIDADPKSGWAVDPQFGKDHAAAFEFAEPVGFAGGTVFTLRLKFANNTQHALGRPRVSVSAEVPSDLRGPAASEVVRAALAAEKRTPEQSAALVKWFAPQDAGWAKLAAAEREHAATAPRPKTVRALVCSEGLPPVRLHSQGEDFLKETHFLRRGDSDQKEGVADLGFLQVLTPDPDAAGRWFAPPPAGSRTSRRRAAFAAWLTDTDAGAGALTARVMANRLWQRHLGRGIVPTVSDFGAKGDPPSHPELLEWLAAELVRPQNLSPNPSPKRGGGHDPAPPSIPGKGDGGLGSWSLKHLHKLIVTSATYRQSSAPVKADPDNKLFARYPVRRLEAEVIRDSILAVGGVLDTTMYGPGTLDEGGKRRSVYFTMKRSKLIPSLVVFDAPDGTAGIGERASTTIAPQALHLLNNPQVRAAAKGFAGRVLAGDPDDPAAVTRAYRLALGRPPTAAELADGVGFLKGSAGAARAAACADLCQVLFCLNEFLYAG